MSLRLVRRRALSPVTKETSRMTRRHHFPGFASVIPSSIRSETATGQEGQGRKEVGERRAHRCVTSRRPMEAAEMRRTGRCLSAVGVLVVTLGLLFAAAPAQAAFGIKTLTVESIEQGGGVDLRAGSHPFGFKVHIEMNKSSEGRPEGTLRQLVVDLPPGMIGNPQAVPRCPMVKFAGEAAHCPGPTQVGVVHLDLSSAGTLVE